MRDDGWDGYNPFSKRREREKAEGAGYSRHCCHRGERTSCLIYACRAPAARRNGDAQSGSDAAALGPPIRLGFLKVQIGSIIEISRITDSVMRADSSTEATNHVCCRYIPRATYYVG